MECPIQWGVEKHPLLISNACPHTGSFHVCVNVVATSTNILITLRKWFSSNIRNNQTTTNASWHTRHAISAGTACVSLQRGLPRQPGPQSHRTDWRNNNNNNYHTATIPSNCSSWPSKTRRRVSLTKSSVDNT